MTEGCRFRSFMAMKVSYRYTKLFVFSVFCAVLWMGEAFAQNENYGTQNASVRALLDQGRAQFVDGQTEVATLTIERALRIEPENPVLWYQIARIRYQMKSWDEAYTLSQRSMVFAGSNYQVLPERNLNLQAAIERAKQGDFWTLAEIDSLLLSTTSSSTTTEVFSVDDGGAVIDGESVATGGVSNAQSVDLTRSPQGHQQQVRIEPIEARGVLVEPISQPIIHRTARHSRLDTNATRQAAPRVNQGSEVVERSIGLGGQGQSRSIPQTAMPAPGYCRVWFDNRQPENQPPIVLCESIGSNIPPGARLIVGRYR